MSDYDRGSEPSFLYCIKSGPYFKVGITSDLDKRMSTIQAHNPFRLTAVFCKKMLKRHVRFVEMEIHKALAPWHHHGEWFTAPLDEIKAAKRKALSQIPRREREHREWVAACERRDESHIRALMVKNKKSTEKV